MNFQSLYEIIDEVDNGPYPKIEDIKPDYKFGRRLYNSYGGSYGEITAILQYVYEDITEGVDKDLKGILLKIAIDEMHHLKTLGELLTKLEFTPYYMGSRNNKWCSDNIRYKFNCISDMLEFNIKGEKDAIREYSNLIDFTESKSIKNIIARIIKDEENHIRILKTLKENYDKKMIDAKR